MTSREDRLRTGNTVSYAAYRIRRFGERSAAEKTEIPARSGPSRYRIASRILYRDASGPQLESPRSTMATSQFVTKLRSGENVFGTFMMLASGWTARVVAGAGWDVSHFDSLHPRCTSREPN